VTPTPFRDTALPLAGVVACLLLLTYVLAAHADLAASLLEPPPSEADAPAGTTASGPDWPVAALLAVTAGTAALLLPPAVLLTAAVVTVHGLGTAALAAPVAGPLLASDVLLLVYLVRALALPRPVNTAPHRLIGPCLVLFLAWSVLATALAGASVTPLLRIAVYGAVFLALSRHGTDRRVVYGVMLGYAMVNLVGGMLQGQTRLVGLDVGDPAQTGALLLAALCPLLTRELRFTGSRVVAAALLGGIFLTQTRGVWFAAIVVLAVWALPRVSLARLVAVFLALGVLGLRTVDWVTDHFGLNGTSIDFRVHSIGNGIRDGLANPLFGSGWGNVSSMSHLRAHIADAPEEVRPYNLFVSVFAFVGVPGLLLLTLALGGLLHALIARKDAPLLFTVAVLAMSLTEMTLYAGSMLTLLFFVYAGMGLGPAEARRSGPVTARRRSPWAPRAASDPAPPASSA
jgi:hypothetical protein